MEEGKQNICFQRYLFEHFYLMYSNCDGAISLSTNSCAYSDLPKRLTLRLDDLLPKIITFEEMANITCWRF